MSIASFLARYPDYAPDDALSEIGLDRGIVRGFEEPASSYAARLKQWIVDRTTKGNPYTLMRQLRGYLTGYDVTFKVVSNNGAWHVLKPDGSTDFFHNPGNWDWDGNPDKWWRFWVIIQITNGPWVSVGKWGSGGVWGDGRMWGASITPEQAKTLVFLINEWKAAHSECWGILMTFDDAMFDPRGSGEGYPNGGWGDTINRPMNVLFSGRI